MPTITDPDFLRDAPLGADSAQNIYVDTAARTIKVRNNEASANANKGPVLDNTGVTLQALYSFLKQEWKDDPNSKQLIAYPFPLIAITPEQFEFRYGWTPADDSSRSLLRTAGWREFALDNSTLKREYLGVISLGNIQGDQNEDEAGVNQHTVYYGFFDSANGTSTAGPFNFDYSGEVNQAVQTLDSSAVDYRGDILRLFIRSTPFQAPQSALAWTFDQTDTTDIGLPAGTTLPYNTQRFPLVEGADLNITVSDATIESAQTSGAKYSGQGDGPTIEYLEAAELSDTFGYTQDLTDGPYNFSVKIDASAGTGGSLTNQELYSWVHYKLRQDSDIETQTATGVDKIGRLQDDLVRFVGLDLETQAVTNIDRDGLVTGVAITNINGDDINNTKLIDDNFDLKGFPFTANVTLSFSNEILADGANARFWVYYDYVRQYGGAGTGTSIELTNVGPSQADASKDSATLVLSGFTATDQQSSTTTPLESVLNPDGLNNTDAEAHFRLGGMSVTSDNNRILVVTNVLDSATASVRALDDDFSITGTSTANASLFTHPVNSPSAVLVDSAATPVENSGGVSQTLAAGNLSEGTYSFQYAYDLNSQFDKITGETAPSVQLNVRSIGLENGSWVEATGTIARQSANAVSVVSPVERNYLDPA